MKHVYESTPALTLSEAAAVGIGGAFAAASFGLTVFCFGVWAGII